MSSRVSPARVCAHPPASRVPCVQSGNTALSRAAAYGHVDVIRLLLRLGASLEARNNVGETPLLRACRWGHVAAAQLLLEAGADRSVRDNVRARVVGVVACVTRDWWFGGVV